MSLLRDSDGNPNAALHDQRLAIQWVADNIHLLGGNPGDITIIGESAGGEAIMHQITAYGSRTDVKLPKAILQSGGFPSVAIEAQDSSADAFLKRLNVTSVADACNVSSAAIFTANNAQILASPYGSFTWGPVVDGGSVPDVPGVSLLEVTSRRTLEFWSDTTQIKGPCSHRLTSKPTKNLHLIYASRFPL